jgi:hypothetical protein
MAKHQEHDQSTHGSWANGVGGVVGAGSVFNEETGYDDLYATYSERYGIDQQGKIVGMSQDQYDALDDYTQSGYLRVNKQLRENLTGSEEGIKNLDKLIAEAPVSFGETTLFRVMDETIVGSLKAGDVMVDKGFISTTRVDITQTENQETRKWFGYIDQETSTMVAVIRPNKGGNGKGIAVDVLRTVVDKTSSISDTEKEVLLPRATPMKFIGFEKSPSGEKDDSSPYDGRVAVFERMDG